MQRKGEAEEMSQRKNRHFPNPEDTKDILVIYEQEAEEWALYLKSLFGHIVKEGGIFLYNLETSTFKHQELFCLPSYKCKLLILSCGLINCLDQEICYFLEQVLKPLENVVILLCGVENSRILYEILTLDGGSKEISTDQKPEEYIAVVTGIIQPGKPQDENPGDSLPCIYEAVFTDGSSYLIPLQNFGGKSSPRNEMIAMSKIQRVSLYKAKKDHQTSSDINLSNVMAASETTDFSFKNEVLSKSLETKEQSILVLPGRVSCKNPGEIFILLKDEIDDETLEIEFISDNQRIRTQTASWNKKVKYVKALDLCRFNGHTCLHPFDWGIVKTTAFIEYYTALEEIEPILKKVADPIAFTCQKEEPRSYRPVSLTSVPGKVMEEIILGGIEKHLKDSAVIGHSQHSFMRGMSCSSNLISFYDKVTHLADQEKPVHVIFLNFSKGFDTVSCRILLDKMASPQLDKHIMWWVSNWFTGRAQRVIVNGVTSDW
ncbi:B-cell scaffold protein with ankyrin repeats-like protein [Pitangus sulphuratus]|nr:B-cell scaffold protein with ankyrin repeats-like protein [Pitangus sulphuratus]